MSPLLLRVRGEGGRLFLNAGAVCVCVGGKVGSLSSRDSSHQRRDRCSGKGGLYSPKSTLSPGDSARSIHKQVQCVPSMGRVDREARENNDKSISV